MDVEDKSTERVDPVDLTKQKILELFDRYILPRTGAAGLKEWLLEADFFTAPASTRFHLNTTGGLAVHSLNVYEALKQRVDNDELCNVSDSSVAVCGLMHDLCKVNFYKKGYRNVKEDGLWVTKEVFEVDEKFPAGDHADKSIIILQNFIRLEPEEILAI